LPRCGDLVVELEAPNGAKRRLKGANRRDRANPLSARRLLRQRLAYNRNGTWKLRVRDATRGYIGNLDSWTITM